MSAAVEVQIPERDVPRPLGLLVVAVASLSAGLGVAWWGMQPDGQQELAASAAAAREGGEVEAGPGPQRREPIGARASDEDERAREGAEAGAREEALAEEEANAGAEEGIRTGTSTSTSEGTGTSAGTRTGSSRSLAELAVHRGRVAYLRCVGVEVRGRRCPRDEALEAAVWPAVDRLLACADPPSTPGEADVRLEYAGAEAPEVAWRDTFSDATVRLDRDRVLACLRPALAGTRQSLGAERLLVSFRFSLAP